jgi:hypothetical protein
VHFKNAVFLDVTPSGSCKNQSFGGIYGLHHQGDKTRSAMKNVSSNEQPTKLTLNMKPNFMPKNYQRCIFVQKQPPHKSVQFNVSTEAGSTDIAILSLETAVQDIRF